jgi:hypothetical protein
VIPRRKANLNQKFYPWQHSEGEGGCRTAFATESATKSIFRAHHGEVGCDAYFFLREPLYRLRSDYAVANCVVWPLCSSPGDADLMEVSYRLSEVGWSPGWTGERFFVYDRRWELSRR